MSAPSIADRRLRDGQSPLGAEGARARRRHRAGDPRPRAAPRPPTAWSCPAWAPSRRRWTACRRSGWPTLIRARRRRRARRCSASAWACSCCSTAPASSAPTDGLGLIAGEVTPLQTGGLRVPHIGWNEVAFRRPSPLTAGAARSAAPPSTTCTRWRRGPRDDGRRDRHDRPTARRSPRSSARDRVFGVQFHPEKSSAHGLRMLRSFVELCETDRRARADRDRAAAAARA